MGSIYQRYELEAFIGSENMDDFDIAAIEAEATEADCKTGDRVWRDGIDLAEICARHEAWRGAGWYRIGYGDGGQDWTNDGSAWMDSAEALHDEMRAAREHDGETHLAWCEYMGDGEEPRKD